MTMTTGDDEVEVGEWDWRYCCKICMMKGGCCCSVCCGCTDGVSCDCG